MKDNEATSYIAAEDIHRKQQRHAIEQGDLPYYQRNDKEPIVTEEQAYGNDCHGGACDV